jgi:hypothetical protein
MFHRQMDGLHRNSWPAMRRMAHRRPPMRQDVPESLRSSTHPVCLMSADGGKAPQSGYAQAHCQSRRISLLARSRLRYRADGIQHFEACYFISDKH